MVQIAVNVKNIYNSSQKYKKTKMVIMLHFLMARGGGVLLSEYGQLDRPIKMYI